MEFKDYYQILGVNDKADAAEIKKAYRKLARKYHPDVSTEDSAEDRFKEVNEAYEVLGDPEKRAEYDQLKKMGAKSRDGSFRPPPDWESAAHFSDGGFTEADMQGFSDFFETVFGRGGGFTHSGDFQRGAGGQRRHTMRRRGDDLHVRVPLFLEEAQTGCERTIDYQVPGFDQQGFPAREAKKLKVKIPAGSSPAKPIRLKGQGGKGLGGAANGDLFLDLEFAPHPVYSVKGNDLYRKLPVAPWEAALGATVKVPTLAGEVSLTIPPDSRSGQQLRLKKRGLNGGDLYVELDIVIPRAANARVKELYREMQKACDFDPRAEVKQ